MRGSPRQADDPPTIEPAQPADLDAVRRLWRAYQRELAVDLCFQGFEAELTGLPGRYAPPGGALAVLRAGAAVVGTVAVAPLAPGVCEMKRLYVEPDRRALGAGQALALHSLATARDLGYRAMRLDTLARLAPARRLYAAMGFREIAPYYANPLADAVYLEIDLALAPAGPPNPRQLHKRPES